MLKYWNWNTETQFQIVWGNSVSVTNWLCICLFTKCPSVVLSVSTILITINVLNSHVYTWVSFCIGSHILASDLSFMISKPCVFSHVFSPYEEKNSNCLHTEKCMCCTIPETCHSKNKNPTPNLQKYKLILTSLSQTQQSDLEHVCAFSRHWPSKWYTYIPVPKQEAFKMLHASCEGRHRMWCWRVAVARQAKYVKFCLSLVCLWCLQLLLCCYPVYTVFLPS